MKKYIVISLASMLLFAGTAFGAASITPAAADGGKTLHGAAASVGATSAAIGKLSTGVYLGAQVTAGGYAIITMHKSGSKAFGSAHDSTAVYYNVTIPTAAPTNADSSSISGAGWTVL